MIHIIIGGAGCGKSTRLISILQEKLYAQEDVLTLVPEQFSYEFDKKLYYHLGAAAFNQIETHSFKSLARAIFQRFGSKPDGKNNADELTRIALIYQVILQVSEREHKLQLLGKQCRQTAFVEELAILFAQLRRSGITPASLYEACVELQGRLLEKTMDLFYLYQAYDRLLEQYHLKDTETELTEAAAIANGQDAFLGSVLLIDEFESFTEDEYEMLTVLLGSCKDVVIALRTEEAEQNPFSLFESVNRTLFRIRRMAEELHVPVQMEHCKKPYRFSSEELAWLSQHIFRNAAPFSQISHRIHLVEASTPSEEAEYVCTTIRRLLAQNASLRCRDIAILSNQLADYHSVLETTMQRYELPYYMDEKQSVLHTPLMVYLHTLLHLLQQRCPNTELLLRLGKTGLTACTIEEIAVLENYCYAWQIDGDTWNRPFTGGEFEAAEEIRQKLLTPLFELRESCREPQSGALFCRNLYEFCIAQKVEEHLSKQQNAIKNETTRMQVQADWTHVWNSWIDILDQMAVLYETVELELTEFCSILSALMRTIQRAVPPRMLDAVFISQGSTARLNAPKIVFVMGVCEGVFPAQAEGNAIFSERDCRRLEQIQLCMVKSKVEQLADARLAAYKLLSAASQELYLTYPCADIAQQKCYPSAVLTQIRRMFPREEGLVLNCTALGSTYYATTLRAAYYRYIQDYASRTAETASIERLLLQDTFYRSRLEELSILAAKHSGHPDTPLFHITNSQLMQQYLGNTIQLSASGMEQYQLCPFSYFCNYILRLFYRQKMQVAGAGGGSLIHYCLERILKEHSRDTFLALSPAILEQKTQRYAEAFWQKEMGGSFSKSSRELAAYHHTILDMQQMMLHLQEELRQSAFYPRYLELAITPDNLDFLPVTLTTPEGQKVRIIGKVDRVDLCEDNGKTWVRVVDYKSGTKEFAIGNLLYGLDMQMLIYLFTITSPGTALSGADPAGILYMPSGKVSSTLERGSDVLPQKHRNDTYRMNGLLLRDSRLITLMEQEGKGIYIPGKLDVNTQIDDRSGIFLTELQMRQLRQYVFKNLIQMASQIYHGEIDAIPLQIQDKHSCSYCVYANICGNRDQMHCRTAEGTRKEQAKQMMEQLDNIQTQKGGGTNGMDDTTAGSN